MSRSRQKILDELKLARKRWSMVISLFTRGLISEQEYDREREIFFSELERAGIRVTRENYIDIPKIKKRLAASLQ